MFKHHQDTINKVTEKMKRDESVLALVIAGSIAHGFADGDADVDIMIVVSGEEYERRHRENNELYLDWEISTYQGGYVDGKYISREFLQDVIRRGGEPARFAFKDAYIAFSRIPGLEELMREAAQYPRQYQAARMRRLYCRFLEWDYFYGGAVKKGDPYLFNASVCNLVLYGGRAVLACNAMLFPFHKWFLKVLESAPDKPNDFMALIHDALNTKAPEAAARFIAAVRGFRDWGVADHEWAKVLMSGEDIGCPESEL